MNRRSKQGNEFYHWWKNMGIRGRFLPDWVGDAFVEDLVTGKKH
jgi:hypothetical protein